jgi:galactosyl transferase GMA12/MNN10 family
MAILISHMDHHHNPQEAEEPAHLELKSKDSATLIKKKPHRWYMSLRNRWFRNSSSSGSGSSSFSWRSYFAVTNVSVCLVGTILVILSTHRVISLIMTHRRWINAPSTYEHRACPKMAYETLSAAATSSDGTAAGTGLKICLTTLTDQKSPSRLQRFIRWRNFDGILDLTWPNKLKYAQKHGYHLVDGSRHIDTSRPPAWSKIHAVRHLLTQTDEPPCDWVMWTDADTVIMNSEIRIQDFLPADSTKDMLVASDKGGGYNSGVFLFRNSAWSKQFLDDWWNMKDFVRPPGLSLSGDNAALKAFLQAMHDRGDFDDHVLVPPRCTFNSFAKFLTVGESLLIKDHWTETLSSSTTDVEHYYKGDFIAHIPGVDNKVECLKLLLAETR